MTIYTTQSICALFQSFEGGTVSKNERKNARSLFNFAWEGAELWIETSISLVLIKVTKVDRTRREVHARQIRAIAKRNIELLTEYSPPEEAA
jgi:hypothetical protein